MFGIRVCVSPNRENAVQTAYRASSQVKSFVLVITLSVRCIRRAVFRQLGFHLFADGE